MAKRNLDPKLLEGLLFDYVEKTESMKDGRKVVQYIPRKRPLTEADILSWRDKGDTVVVVTGNGKKLSLKKSEIFQKSNDEFKKDKTL